MSKKEEEKEKEVPATDVEEEEKDDVEDIDIDIELDDDLEEENSTKQEGSNNTDDFRSRIIKMFGIVTVILIVILIIGFLVSLFTKKNYTYGDVEDILTNAATKYFKDHKTKLPQEENEVVEINSDTLISNNYMKKLDSYINDDSCRGKVTVEKHLSSYNYIPVLTCKNSNYKTKKLLDIVKDSKNLVSEGFGIYYMNGEYVYRGAEVNNFVRFKGSDRLWRIIKVTSNNEIALISSKVSNNLFSWDNRYNNKYDDNTGINMFKNSSISSTLENFYKNDLTDYYEEVEFISDKEKRKMIDFNACVGPRDRKDTSKDGHSECSVTQKVRVSLLPVYDFLNASLDENCNSTTKPDCQNYNYLSGDRNYWLANGDSENNNKVYYLLSPGQIVRREASDEYQLRLVIHIGENANVEKGKGTKKDPYIVR